MICDIQLTYAKGETKSSTEADIYSNIDDYLQKCVENANIPAMSVSIVNKNEVLFSGNYGQCENNDTPFFLGSVSKSFTAVCIMQLVEQQEIDLTATISTICRMQRTVIKSRLNQLPKPYKRTWRASNTGRLQNRKQAGRSFLCKRELFPVGRNH